MSSPDAEPAHRPEITNDESTEAASAVGRGPDPVRLWLLTLAAGALAGLVSWWAAEPIYGRYRPEPSRSRGMPSIEESNANELKLREGITTETSYILATLGAAVGLALGLAGGLARGSIRAALAAGVVGLVVAAAGGFVATRLMLPIYFGSYRPDGNDLGLAILAQGVIAAVVGAAAGAAFGLGLRDGGRLLDFRFLAGGLLGAIAGVLVYQLAGAIAFPFDGTALPVSAKQVTRLLDHGSIAMLCALGVLTARSFGPRKP
jgi:hypothetical protein